MNTPASIIFESLSYWPLAAAVGGALTVAVLWLYPAQVRGAGLGRWIPPLLRWLAVVALAVSLLKPVVLEPKSAEQWGSVVVLVDCSKSMSVVDPGRAPAERVALAGALGRLPAGLRSETVASLGGDLERLETRVREVIEAQSDLDYARVSGRGIAEKQEHLQQTMEHYGDAARTLAARSASIPQETELCQRLKELQAPPHADLHEAWPEEARRQIERVQAASHAFQATADEQLYKSNADVRSACDAMAKSSRLELAEEALLRSDAGLVARLSGEVPFIGLAIRGELSPVALSAHGRPVPRLGLTADAGESDLAGAVTTALNGLANRPVRAVVLISDGRQVGGRGDITSGLRPAGVPVFTVGVAAERTPDLCVSNISLPALSAFAGEKLEGEAEVTDDGGIQSPVELHVSSSAGDEVVPLSPRTRRDRREHGREWAARFSLAMNSKSGQAAERVVFSVPVVPGEATAANNRVERWIKVSSDKLKVALCTAAPTWDFQYLRSALSRGPWVQLESQVLDPEHPRLGLTPQQILEQDVLVLSDIPVSAPDVNQWDAIHGLIDERGGSVIVVAGTNFPVSDYAQQPIAKTLLPFHDVRPTWKEWPGEQPAFHFAPTPLGEREALRLGDNSESAIRRWQELPGLYRYLQIPEKNLTPGVQPLLVESDGRGPVLTERRLGAGRVLFLGLNETWRWRLKGGEREADQFWRQLVRHAAGEPYASSQGPLALDVDRVASTPGEMVHVRARVRGAKSPAASATSCQLDVLSNGKSISVRPLTSTSGGRFVGQISDLPEGDYQLELRGLAADGRPVAARVPLHVAASDEAEMRDVSGDPAMLTRIARSSGGQYLPIEQVDRLSQRIKELHETESQFIRRPLWNSPMFFGFVLACFGGEWALRKRFGLA